MSAPSVEMAHKIADELDVSFLWLAVGEGAMKQKNKKNPDILAPENLKEISVDLYTVISAAEDLINKAQKEKNASAKTIARDIVLRCMSVPDR